VGLDAAQEIRQVGAGEFQSNGVAAVLLQLPARGPRRADWRHENPPPGPTSIVRSAFADFRFPPDVIVLAVRW
jgi:hypothetical protein